MRIVNRPFVGWCETATIPRMVINGLWSIDFSSNATSAGGAPFGSGVIVVNWPHLLGGDGSYLYIGTIGDDGDEIEATIKVRHYAGSKWTVFGVEAENFTIMARGERPVDDAMWLVGNVTEDSRHEIILRLRLRQHLP